MAGGGRDPAPGEISLAHNGILFLDELPEFERKVLEMLREPLESGSILISRAKSQEEFPAKFQLIATMNPCPCGNLNHPVKSCCCSYQQIAKYKAKVSGPLLDRIDLHIEVPYLSVEHYQPTKQPELSTKEALSRIHQAAAIAYNRQGKMNAALTCTELFDVVILSKKDNDLILKYVHNKALSSRVYHKILKVARTIADLEGKSRVCELHLTQALTFCC